MRHFSFKPRGVCAKEISFAIENGNLHHVQFVGGCPGNTLALSKLLDGTSAARAVKILKGNPCGDKKTSCADQLACGIERALSESSQNSEGGV